MTQLQVILPVQGFVEIDARYQAILGYLNQQQATIHLMIQHEQQPMSLNEDPQIVHQQAQVARLHMYLKYEIIDRMANALLAQHPQLTVQRHVTLCPLNQAVSDLREKVNAKFIVLDQRDLGSLTEPKNKATLQYLAIKNEVPIWCVGEHSDSGTEVLTVLDIQPHETELEANNCTLINAAALMAEQRGLDVTLLNSWQPDSNSLPQWLPLAMKDLSQFEQMENQRRESLIVEYIGEQLTPDLRFNIQVHAGATALSILNRSALYPPAMVVVGLNKFYSIPDSLDELAVPEQFQCDVLLVPPSASETLPEQWHPAQRNTQTHRLAS